MQVAESVLVYTQLREEFINLTQWLHWHRCNLVLCFMSYCLIGELAEQNLRSLESKKVKILNESTMHFLMKVF